MSINVLSPRGILLRLPALIVGGGKAFELFKDSGKVQRIAESHRTRHLRYRKIAPAQKAASLIDTVFLQIVMGRKAKAGHECSVQLTAADTCIPGQIHYADIVGIIVLNIPQGLRKILTGAISSGTVAVFLYQTGK